MNYLSSNEPNCDRLSFKDRL